MLIFFEVINTMLFEIYIQEEKITKEQWYKFIYKIYKNLGQIGDFTLEVLIDQTQISYYIKCDKDLTVLGSEIFPFILKPEQIFPDKPMSAHHKWMWALKFEANDTILSLREREVFKKSLELYRVSFHFKKSLMIYTCPTRFYFENGEGEVCSKKKGYTNLKASKLLEVDFLKSTNYKKKNIPLYLKLQKNTHLFSDKKEEGFMEVLGFPYFSKPKYYSIKAFEANKHSLIVGQTGTGKSKLLELLIKQMLKNGMQNEYSIIVLDPHAVMYSEFVAEAANIDFIRNACSLFTSKADSKVSTELTIMLFKSVLKDQFNPKMERLLKFSLYTLSIVKAMTFEYLKRFLTEIEFRKKALQQLPPTGYENVIQFFDTDFIELQTKYYEQSIMPILVLLDELNFMSLGNVQNTNRLDDIVNKFDLTILSLNKMTLGEKATKLVAGLLIQQIFILAQSKAFKKKVIFIIDEVSIVQNEALNSILSEARKFGLSLYLTQQYLQQIDESLLKSVITNTYNYFVFKVSEEDASLLAKNLNMEFTDELLLSEKAKGFDEEQLKIKMITELNSRECILRAYSGNQFLPCFKARTMDV